MEGARTLRQVRAMQRMGEQATAGAIARNSHEGHVPQGSHLCRRNPTYPT